MKGRTTNEMHGTPQAYLSFAVARRPAASMAVKRPSTGARDLNAVLRLSVAGDF